MPIFPRISESVFQRDGGDAAHELPPPMDFRISRRYRPDYTGLVDRNRGYGVYVPKLCDPFKFGMLFPFLFSDQHIQLFARFLLGDHGVHDIFAQRSLIIV